MEIVRCPNCSAQLLGVFPAVGHELLSLDFKSVKSLAALFRTGYLADEFLNGRRQRFSDDIPINMAAQRLTVALT